MTLILILFLFLFLFLEFSDTERLSETAGAQPSYGNSTMVSVVRNGRFQ